ncbi:MAG TPA: hydrolase [Prolixibacteraceae bacterium]
METTEDPICCPKFDPAPWDDKNFEWNDKIFVKGSVFTIFYMPLNFGGTMMKMDKKIREAGADWSENICLSDHTSSWNMDLFISVDKRVSTLENKIMTGKFYSKVYEGPFKDTGKWLKEFNQILVAKGYKGAKVYAWYTTCPKCAKKYGKNYVVMIAKVG